MAKRPTYLPSKAALQKRMWHWEDESFSERCPALYEFLSTGVLEGVERKGGSISLFCSNGQLKVCFTDRHTQLAFYGVLDGTGELYAVLEAMLISPPEPWTPLKESKAKPVF